MKSEKLNKLIEKYYAGETSLREEKKLKEALTPENEYEKALFDYTLEERHQTIPTVFDQKINVNSTKKIRSRKFWSLAAASILILLISINFLRLQNTRLPNNGLITLKMGLQSSLVSERLKTLDSMSEEEQKAASAQTLLLNTLVSDRNINVRLAALRALEKQASKELLKELVNSLIEQNSPMVQLALIDLIISNADKVDTSDLKDLLNSENVFMESKTRLNEAIAL